MNIAKIGLSQSEAYIPREIKYENLKPSTDNLTQNDNKKLNSWQEEILISGVDKLVNNIQMDNNHPLSRLENSPIEDYKTAMDVLSSINIDSIRAFGSEAQANVTASTFLQLIMD